MGAWRAAAMATEFGFAVVGSLVGGIVVGQLLDRRLGTAPAFFLIGLIGGFVFSIYLIYVIYRVQVQPRRRAQAGPPAQVLPARASPSRSATSAASAGPLAAGRSPSREAGQVDDADPR